MRHRAACRSAPVWLRALLATSLLASAAPLAAQDAEGNPPAAFDSYWMVFLERGDNPPELDQEASQTLQRKHLAHLSRMWTEGYALVAGPFDAGPDEALRGIVLYRGNLERDEVLELAGGDPAVKAGRLEVRALRWYTAADALTFAPPPSTDDPEPSS